MKKEVIIYTSIFALAFILTSVALFFLTRDKNAAAADSLSTSILDSIKILQDEKKKDEEHDDDDDEQVDKYANYTEEEKQFLMLIEKLKELQGPKKDESEDVVQVEDKTAEIDSTLIKLKNELVAFKKKTAELNKTIVQVRDSLQKSNKTTITQRSKITELEKKNAQLIAAHKNEILEIKTQQTNENLKKLIRVYNNMDPKKAAEILPKMPLETGVAILKSIEQKRAAKIIAAMPAQVAAKFSQKLSE